MFKKRASTFSERIYESSSLHRSLNQRIPVFAAMMSSQSKPRLIRCKNMEVPGMAKQTKETERDVSVGVGGLYSPPTVVGEYDILDRPVSKHVTPCQIDGLVFVTGTVPCDQTQDPKHYNYVKGASGFSNVVLQSAVAGNNRDLATTHSCYEDSSCAQPTSCRTQLSDVDTHCLIEGHLAVITEQVSSTCSKFVR